MRGFQKCTISFFIGYTILMIRPTAVSLAQGCSDAGFCTLSGIKPEKVMFEEANQFGFGLNVGAGDLDTDVLGLNLSYRRNLSKILNLGLRASYQRVSGALGTVSGLSDLFISSNIKVAEHITFTGGLKVPFNRSTSASFPMEYQSSVGTFDLLLGAAWESNGFGISAGYQQPLTQNDYRYDSISSFTRKPDLILRIFYQWPILKDKITVTPSILNIYHVGEDSYTYENLTSSPITGSSGLTLNANVYATWHINQSFDLALLFATPFIVRDTRPDGLTRSFVTGVELKYRF